MEKEKIKQFGFYFNQERCIGCRTCDMACKDYKRLEVDQSFRRVYEYETGGWNEKEDGKYECSVEAYYTSISCNHCSDPVCTHACPTGAMAKDKETGVVSVDEDMCIGCKSCAMACPYGAPQFNEKKGVMQKCDGCAERAAVGRKPICVEACPNRALDAGDITMLSKQYGTTLASIAPLVDASITHPSLCITPAQGAKPSGYRGGKMTLPLVDEEVLDV